MITSNTNEFIKYLVKLKQKKYRDIEHKFLVEGEHLIKEAYNNSLLDTVILTEDYNCDIDTKKVIVTKEIMKKISMLNTPPNIIGLCNMKEENNTFGDKVVILDGIQDPGNLGTIIRSSLAFNVKDIILSNDTVDLYNDKVLRATQGIIFSLNIVRRNLEEEIAKLKSNNYIIYTTDVRGGIDIRKEKETSKWGLIMGNEGNGVRDKISSLADKKVYINMHNNVESLNVGVATSIILYELNSK